MTPAFSIRTVPQFDRLLRRLSPRHPELAGLYAEALEILRIDPYNRSRQHNILKLTSIPPGEGGQYRLALRRFRFRYDIEAHDVVLYYCGLRREDTYR
jgi:hypothetical protein